MRPVLAILALAGFSASCAAPSYPSEVTSPQPAERQSMLEPRLVEPQQIPAEPPKSSPPAPAQSPIPRPSLSADSCGAAQMQGMVGHLRTLIPVPVDPNRQRVACITCPKAQDEDPRRLNFLFDPGSGVIKEVRCG